MCKQWAAADSGPWWLSLVVAASRAIRSEWIGEPDAFEAAEIPVRGRDGGAVLYGEGCEMGIHDKGSVRIGVVTDRCEVLPCARAWVEQTNVGCG